MLMAMTCICDLLMIFNQPAGGEQGIKVIGNGAVELYHANVKKLNTKSDGINVTGEVECTFLDLNGNADISGNLTVGGLSTIHGNIDLQDDDKILLGTGDDLQIYHNGTNSYIENYTGNLTFLMLLMTKIFIFNQMTAAEI